MTADLLSDAAAHSAARLPTIRVAPLIPLLLAFVFPATAAAQGSLDRILFEAAPIPGTAPAKTAAGLPLPATPALVTRLGPLLGAQDPGADVEAYRQSIAAIELDGGPFAPALLEQYLALGESLQQRDDHEAALAAFDKADYISRINNGLYSPEQFAIVENMIESHLARGEIVEAGNKQRYLLLLNEQHYGENSLELVPALKSVADWNFNVFNRQLRLPNAIVTVNADPTGPGGRPLSPRAMAFGSLFQSQANYWRAINIMLNEGRYLDPELHALESKLIETAFLSSNRDGLINNPDFYLGKRSAYTGTRIRRSTRPSSPHFFTGRSAYERLLAYQVITPGINAETMGRTLIELGDWHLLFDRQGAAIGTYQRAHAFLVANGVPQATIDAMFSPALPQHLPTFTPLPHSRAKLEIPPGADVSWDGHLDISFRIGRFGQVGRFELLGSSGPVTKEIETRLKRFLRSTPFRPRFVDGEPARSDEVQLRVYFARIE